MSVDPWTKPPRAARLVTCGVVAAIHAVLVLSYRTHNGLVPGDARKGHHITFLLLPAVPDPAVKSESVNNPAPRSAGKTLPAPTLPSRRAAPEEAAAPDEVDAHDEEPAMRNTADVNPDWTAAQSVKSAPDGDVRAVSLRLAGRADAELRQGKPAALVPDDTPLQRMRSRMAQATRGGGNSTTTAVSSTGESITILTRNGKRHCYVPVSTRVAPSAVFDNRGSGRATEIQCPKELR